MGQYSIKSLLGKIAIFGFLGVLLIIPFAQNSEGIAQTAGNLVYDIQPGDSQTQYWGLSNTGNNTPVTVTLDVTGDGSEFVSLPKTLTLPPDEWVEVAITVTIPEGHPIDVYLGPRVSAFQEAADTGQIVRIHFKVEKQLDVIIGNAVIPEFVPLPIPTPVETTPEQEEEIIEEKPEPAGSFSIAQTEESAESQEEGGGCLISTATYGSEMASQVQMLREIRDNGLLTTESGTSFMSGFNTLYYSFSPAIADFERQSPIFREAVKLTITPLITSLSLLNYVDMDSEAKVLGFGVSLILLNGAMYFVAPVIVITQLRKRYSTT